MKTNTLNTLFTACLTVLVLLSILKIVINQESPKPVQSSKQKWQAAIIIHENPRDDAETIIAVQTALDALLKAQKNGAENTTYVINLPSIHPTTETSNPGCEK